MTGTVSASLAGTQVERLHPRPGGRWPGRWTGEDGRPVYGLFDPTTGAVEVVDPSRDRKLPALAHWLRAGSLVAYRPTRRAVVRVTGPTRYVKIVRPGRTATLVRAHAALAAAGSAGERDFPDVAPVLHWSDGEGVVVLGEVAGCSLHDVLLSRAEDVTGDLRRVACALAAFHRAAVPTPGDLPWAGGRSLEDWVASIAPLLPDGSRQAYMAAVVVLPPQPGAEGGARLVHGDLHDRNIVLTDGRVGVIDVDSLGAGHPAEDVGNLAAHLVLRSLQASGHPERGRRRAVLLLQAYRACGGPADEASILVSWARALVRLACVYAVRPRWSHLCATLLEEAAATLVP